MSIRLQYSAFIVLLLFSVAPFYGSAQRGTPPLRYYEMETSLGFVGGIHQGRHTYGEIGFGYGCLEDVHGYIFWGVAGSVEASPWNDVYAVKASVWRSMPFLPLSFGFSSVAYFQHGKYDQALRPSIGIAYRYLHLTYSYDFNIGKRSINERNRHMVSLRYFLPTITLKKESWSMNAYGSR